MADVYSRLLPSFILLMMDVESFGSVLHHNNGTVMRVTRVGMHAMKIKGQMKPKDMIPHRKNPKTGMMRTSHLLTDTALMW